MAGARLLMLLLAGVLLAGLGWLLAGDRSLPVNAPRVAAGEPPPRRGDDPTYAEELRSMSALLQRMRYDLQELERTRQREQRELSAQVRRETDNALRQAREENRRLSETLRAAREELERRIQAASEAPRTEILERELDQLRVAHRDLNARFEALRAGSETDEPEATALTAAAEEDRPEANRVLQTPSVAEPLRERRDRAPSADTGSLRADAEALEQLRRLPGMADIADSLAQRAVIGPERAAAPGTTRPGYVTLRPYVAGGGSPPPLADRSDAGERWHIGRYPFEIQRGRHGVSAVIPVYTLPDAATLVDNSTMTPLIGRVPAGGRLTDPYRFKLITGATNLASNGHRIPGIVNAVWTGYAVGVREQSCVRAYVDTVTFTFEDGRLHTVHRGKGSESPRASVTDTLGYLTDPWGKPCIRGQTIDNASRYLRGRGMAAFLDGLANAYARSQVTLQRDALGGVSATVDGNTYEYALGRGVSGATGEIADYVRERADDAFDVIYVPPGINVQLFVETAIPIDYDTRGRRLRYDYAAGETRDARE